MCSIIRRVLVVLFATGAATAVTVLKANPQDRIGETVQDVILQTLEGKPVELFDHHTGEVLVVAYTGLGCPISGRYAPRLEELAKRYEKRGVRFVGINANPHDTPKQISSEIKELGIESFPILKDADQALTRQLDATTTTETFVIDKNKKLRYRGMIDDQYAVGAQRTRPKNKYLDLAIKDVLNDRDPFTQRTPAPGCRITLVKPAQLQSDVTYASHVARIMQDNCQSCHRLDQIAPFPLTTYEEVRGWSAMIHAVVQEGRMPPWNAHRDHDGIFINERKMPEEDQRLLLAWIAGGMPRGNPKDDPPAREWPKGWRIGKPDKVLEMRRPFRVPAEGVVEYQYFYIPTFFTEDKWIQAIEAKAGAEDVVHHIVVFAVDPNDKSTRPERLGLEDGFLCAMVPGDTPSIFPEGTAKKIPAGWSLVLQVHYTTNGKQRKDKCSVGIIFADNPPEREVKTRGIYNFSFEIPPHAPSHEVRAEHTFAEDTEIFSLYPHMHFRGKSWKYIAHYPDGRQETLLNVPRYDYNWQESYILKKPILLPKGTKLECIAVYDNSASNFANPDPSLAVRFGEQSWEEMMIGYIDYLPAKQR